MIAFSVALWKSSLGTSAQRVAGHKRSKLTEQGGDGVFTLGRTTSFAGNWGWRDSVVSTIRKQKRRPLDSLGRSTFKSHWRWLMIIELQATSLVLKKWNQNPEATKRQIGIWQHWEQETEDNDRSLTGVRSGKE